MLGVILLKVETKMDDDGAADTDEETEGETEETNNKQ
jgi:hypothetical protein